MRLIIVSGRSGSGKSTALNVLEDNGFYCIDNLPAGLLPQIGAGLAVSEALAGQLVSVYALGSLLAALPAASLTQGWRRRRVLLLALLIFFVCNSLTAVSSDYRLTLLARFGSGVAAGLDHAQLLQAERLGDDVDERLLLVVELDAARVVARAI